ncbi:DMT family transporter [Halogeometricum limi]|uniref:Permease of the drug/metabolite transporter (DMT) superfamily n=1 Tax=Halogeometricum limi TaxID=555875 RepID=A0A1I6IGN7_9EURY|nr:DMT family transporter [Halogeometricum limi]SFR65480.1 Permease of the drug/metabolite transporter (DMT) superfamily [Halogeometricum limi]
MSRLRDLLAFCTLACLWGLSVAAVEIGFASFPPLLLSAFRYDIAGALLLGYVAATRDDWYPTTRGDAVSILGGGVFWIAVGNGVWFVGQGLTSSVLSGLMTSLTPIATAAVSWVVLLEDRLTVVSLFGLFVSFGGALLFVLPTGPATLTAAVVGKLLLLVGVAGLAVGSVLMRWASTSLASVPRTAWATLVGAAFIHVLSVLAGEQWSATVTTTGLASLLYLSVGATVVGYVLFFTLLDRHPAIEVTLVTYLVPVVAAAAGWLLFGEAISARMGAGFAVVVVGFLLMKRRELRAEFARLESRR